MFGSSFLPDGGEAFENFTGFEIIDAIEHGFLNVAAGHFHEIALRVLFLDQRA